MLTHLRVRNLAIIEEIEVELGPGLNVLTGETGAGKSILVTALQLVLGARGRPEVVRTGAVCAEVEALFALDPPDPEYGDEIVVRRVVEAEGRTRAYINGRLATAGQLAELAAGLVDISSQHEHHTLVNPATHLGYLDAYAGIGALSDRMAEAFATYREAGEALEALRASLREDRGGLLRFQLKELEGGEIEPGKEEEAERLRHAAELSRAAGSAEAVLYADDGSVCDVLSRVIGELDNARRHDPALNATFEQISGARTELEDAAHALARYQRGVRADPERLAALEEGLHEARRLRRKYGDDLVAVTAGIRRQLAELEGAADQLDSVAERRERAEAKVRALAAELTARRRAEATKLAAAITAELASLGMGEARVAVEIAEVGLGAHGADHVEFLIATNRGEDPRPLRKVASGGELSRSLLAVKRVLAALGPAGLYVFDEVDSGVGGAIAEVIGHKLADVARHHQVLCITHLPQIAAHGDTHFHVRKEAEGDRTRSYITRLTTPERVEELARMLGGVRVSDAARAAARELMGAGVEPV